MSWTHISSSGSESASGSQTSLSATFPVTIPSGAMIVASVVWVGTETPVVSDSANDIAYEYIGPTPAGGVQAGTWVFIAPAGSSSFQVNVSSGGSNMSLAIDAYTFSSGTVVVDVQGYASGTGTSPALGSPLSPSASDLIYAVLGTEGTPGTFTPASGFALRYNSQGVGGNAYGIAVQDYANESGSVNPSFSFPASEPWFLNGIAFKAVPRSATIVGPTQGLTGLARTFTLSLNGPAPAGGITVTLSSSNGSDTFPGATGGSSVTIPAGAMSGTFNFLPGSAGSRNITISAGGVSCPSPYAFNSLATATSYTVTGPSGGHQLAPATWTINLVGGDFNGTITATPGGGVCQCELYTPSTITFTGNGTLSKTFTFTPLIVDSVTFTFTNSGTMSNPSSETYVSTGEYLVDAFSGTAGTAITGHNSNSLTSGVAGSTYTAPAVGAIELDGSGGVYLSTASTSSLAGISVLTPANTAYSYSDAAMPASQNMEVIFELTNGGSLAGTFLGVNLLGTGSSNLGFGWLGNINQLAWLVNGRWETDFYGHSNGPAAGVSWMIKLDLSVSGGYLTVASYYSTNLVAPYTWQLMSIGTANPNSIPLSSIPTTANVGVFFTNSTGGTGYGHIGNLTVQDITPPTPNCQISKAYVTTSGQMAAFYFETISGGTAVIPTAMNFSPSFFRNGTSIGQGTYAWTSGIHSCALVWLPSGITILPTDTVTVSAPAQWMTCGTGNAAAGASGLSLANHAGDSCFGTDSLTKTFKPGVNFSAQGTSQSTFYNVPMNWRYRLNQPGGTITADGYPTVMDHVSDIYDFCDFPTYTGNGLDGTLTPGMTGYWAIGYDDNYIAAGGVASQLAIVSTGTGSVVTPVTANNNPGTLVAGQGYQGQFYLFHVTADGSGVANIPLGLEITNSAQAPHISKLWIVGPGDFTVPAAGVTSWSFPRSNPYALSGQFLARFANGCGSTRWLDASLSFGGSTNVTEPWEMHGQAGGGNGGDGTDFSWNTQNFGVNNIGYTTLRALNLSGSSYAYFPGGAADGAWPGSPYALTLNSAVSATATTFSINAGGDAAAIPVPGLLLYMASGGEKCRIRTVSGTSSPFSVFVERGSSGTTPTAQSSGTIQCNGRVAITSLSQFTADGNQNAQLTEVVCAANHNLKTGTKCGFGYGSFPTLYFTDGSSGGVTGTPIVVTGPTTFVINTRNGNGTLGPSSAYPSAPTSYTLSGCGWYWTVPDTGFPPDFIAQTTGYFPGCNLHVNMPLCATDSYVYNFATIIKNNFPAGRKVYVELADEFWNGGQDELYQAYCFMGFRGDTDIYTWQVLRTGQIRTIFRNVFGSRANEVMGALGGWYSATGQTQDLLNLCRSNSVTIDALMVAPYLGLGNDAATIAACNNANIQQNIDIWIHDVYCNQGGLFPLSATVMAQIAAYNAATGANCVMHGYEGGYQTGPSASSNYPMQMTRDMPLDPNWRIIEKDMYAAFQSCGFANLNLYSFSIYYDNTNDWGLYHWIYQQPGKGDGSDGLFNNRLCVATPGYDGPLDFTKSSTTNQDANTVSVRGQAFLEWMAAANTPTIATLTGPTAGPLGVKSSVFTVTLNQPAQAGGVVVTTTSTGGADVLSSS